MQSLTVLSLTHYYVKDVKVTLSRWISWFVSVCDRVVILRMVEKVLSFDDTWTVSSLAGRVEVGKFSMPVFCSVPSIVSSNVQVSWWPFFSRCFLFTGEIIDGKGYCTSLSKEHEASQDFRRVIRLRKFWVLCFRRLCLFVVFQ